MMTRPATSRTLARCARRAATTVLLATQVCLAGALPTGADEGASTGPQNGPTPASLMRRLTMLRTDLVQGRAGAIERHDRLRVSITQQMTQITALDVWSEPQQRMSLISFVATGGNPRTLAVLLRKGLIPKEEMALATGVLWYVQSDYKRAAKNLQQVEAKTLPAPTRAIFELISAVLIAESDLPAARLHLVKARMQSIGTFIEEAALRAAVSIESRAQLQGAAHQAATRLLFRFPRSPYLNSSLKEVLGVFARTNHAADIEGQNHVSALLTERKPTKRFALLVGLAREALQHGSLETVRFAARQSLNDAADDQAAAKAQAYLGAALVVDRDSQKGLELLNEAESQTLDGETSRLVAAARDLVRGIEELPEAVSSVPDSGEGQVDGALKQTFADISARLEEARKIEERSQ